MSDQNSQEREATPELRMLWYPHLPAGTLSPEVLDAALRRGRRERAEMLAAIGARVATLVAKGTRALFRSIARIQERRARVALARNLMHPAVSDFQAAGRGEFPGPVLQILSQPESHQGNAGSATRPDDHPRLAA